MQMTLQYFTGCPNWRVAEARLREAIDRSDEAVDVAYEVVETLEDAERLGFRGSPTVLVNGRDAFPDQAGPIGMSCRIYRTDNGPQGAPTVEQLVEVLAR